MRLATGFCSFLAMSPISPPDFSSPDFPSLAASESANTGIAIKVTRQHASPKLVSFVFMFGFLLSGGLVAFASGTYRPARRELRKKLASGIQNPKTRQNLQPISHPHIKFWFIAVLEPSLHLANSAKRPCSQTPSTYLTDFADSTARPH